MTDFLLRAKHWLLFVLLIVPTIFSQVVSMRFQKAMNRWSAELEASDGDLGFSFPTTGEFMAEYGTLVWIFVVLSVLAYVVQYGWYWAVGTRLAEGVPVGTRLNVKLFKGLMIFLVGALLLLSYQVVDFVSTIMETFSSDVLPDEAFAQAMMMKAGGLFIVGMLAFAATIYCVIHVGKVIRSIEMGRPAPGSEYAGYSILAILLFIGVWMLQPKVNRYLATGKMEKEESAGPELL